MLVLLGGMRPSLLLVQRRSGLVTARMKFRVFAILSWMMVPGASSRAEQSTGAQTGPMLDAEMHVVARSPDPGKLFLYEPALVKLPSGGLLVTFEHTLIDANAELPHRFRLAISKDAGGTWQQLPPLDLHSAQPFVHEGRLYLLGNLAVRRNIVILRSDDEGRSWTGPVTLFEGSYWNAPTGVLIKDGRLYRSFNLHEDADGTPNLRNYEGCVVIAADLSRNLLDPAAWRMSNRLDYPGTPPLLTRVPVEGRRADHWLESNLVEVSGEIRGFHRLRIPGGAAHGRTHQSTAGLAAVTDLRDDGKSLKHTFEQFYPIPGAQNKFHIIRDEPSGLYWMAGNIPVDSLGRVPGGDDRRILILMYSVDAHNWFQAGCVAMSKKPREAYNYASLLPDGDDLLLAVRTALGGRQGQAKSTHITFHRVRDFRPLALDLPAGRHSASD